MKRLLLVFLALFTVSAYAQNQGGEMVVSFQNDVSTLDPAIGYDWQNWSIIKSIFDGLMDYKPGTTQLVPQLAESYEISEDGLTYSFKLREGVTFHNGREMVADDVKYSFERMLNPETQSPGVGFYLGIEGAQAYIDGTASEVTGIRVTGPYTIEFQLTQPDATFLHKLALNFAHVVPQEAVEKYGQDFGHNPVGTGAFMLEEWSLGQQLVLVRNPDYFIEGRPYLDRIVFNIGLDPNVAYLQLLRDQVDILGDGIPAANFTEVMNDPELRELVEVGEQLQTSYITLNTTVEPLDDPKVRKALNMAINKERIVRIINNRASPANQILPPLMPGYATDYEGYPFDPEQAKALLAEAGYPEGFSTTLYAYNVAPNDRIAQAIQQDLAQIGVDVDLRTLAQSVVIEAASSGEAPMVWSGGMAWIADYPDANNFYWPILSCASAVPGGWNWARYCNEEVEQAAAEADTMVQPDQEEARIDIYRQLFVQIMEEDAPWIPVFNEKRFTMHSSRVGGPEGIFTDPIHIPVNYEMVRIINE